MEALNMKAGTNIALDFEQTWQYDKVALKYKWSR